MKSMRASRRSFLWQTGAGITGLAAAGPALAAAASPDKRLFYVGTYTGAKSKGIYAFRLDTKSGALEPLGLAAESSNPSFLAIHPNGRFLYSVNEAGKWKGQSGGFVTAFRIDRESGRLTEINQQSSVGDGPCHLVVDQSGHCVLLANYGGGSIAALPIKTDGALSPHTAFIQHTGSSVNPDRQKEPHAHSINVSPDNRFAYVADLGLDRVLIYRLDAAKGTLTPNDVPFVKVAPGSGPRHFAFHPSGGFAYVINEMLCTVTAFKHDRQSGGLTEIQTASTLPAGEPLKPEYSTAEVVAHPGGRFLYGSNRGHNSIAVFSVAKDGRLALVQNADTQGKTPRNFALDPSGGWLFAENQDSGTIVQFKVDQATGRLTPTGRSLDAGTPVCLRWVPVG
jgi:6-phosphogluconolactonase